MPPAPDSLDDLLRGFLPFQAAGMTPLLEAGAAWDPEELRQLHSEFLRRQSGLWMAFLAGSATAEPVGAPDRRFRAPEWKSHPFFEYLRRAYQDAAKSVLEAARRNRLDDKASRRLMFFTRQTLDALCPANFPALNPEVLRLAIESRGESLRRGVANLLADQHKGRISMTDESAFRVGENLAVTPGGVVFENEVMQIIQYAPATPTVHERPLLVVPPFINKFYILDLRPDNSFVRYAVDQGMTVFVVSWRNIPRELGTLTWEDYVEQAVFKGIEVALEITGAPRLNLLGFCVGGTLAASALAVLRARGDERVSSLTLLTTLLDFADPGEIGVYIDSSYVARREQDFRAGGVLPGRELASAFASLRANELVWHYVVNNYLKGNSPEPFDLLYWNSDSANLPGQLFAWYARNMYLENRLREPDSLTLCGTPVDLTRIDVPSYVLATREDHIVPWQGAYASARLLGGQVRFVLGASGHIAGVVNSVSENRRSHWTGLRLAAGPEQWLAKAKMQPGSWWPDWMRWLRRRSGRRVKARAVGDAGRPVIEPAPGRYVRERADTPASGPARAADQPRANPPGAGRRPRRRRGQGAAQEGV